MMICMILWLIKMFKIIIKRFNLFDWFMVSLFLLFILSIIILLKKPNNLVDEKVLSKWAIDERVNISEEEASDEAVRIGGLNPKDCKKTLAKVNLLRNRLKDNLVKFREGKYISINFGLYANPKPITAPPGVKSEEDRLNKLKEERDYADILTDSIYKEINDKKISFEEAMEKVRNDPKVGNKSTYETSFQSQAFTADDYNNKTGLLSDDSIIERINALSEGQMSEPFVHKINVAFCASEPGCEPEIIDSRWIILKVERIGKGLQGTAESLLADVRKQYKAEIF